MYDPDRPSGENGLVVQHERWGNRRRRARRFGAAAAIDAAGGVVGAAEGSARARAGGIVASSAAAAVGRSDGGAAMTADASAGRDARAGWRRSRHRARAWGVQIIGSGCIAARRWWSHSPAQHGHRHRDLHLHRDTREVAQSTRGPVLLSATAM